MCLKDLHLLQSNNLINMDDGFVLAPTGNYISKLFYFTSFN